MKNKSSIDYLIEETTKHFKVVPKDTTKGFFETLEQYRKMVYQAKLIEKSHIECAYIDGMASTKFGNGTEYYNEHFNLD